MLLLAMMLVLDSAVVREIPVAPAETLVVTIAGAGQPVVMVPGLFGSAFAFRDVATELSTTGHRTLIVEPLGIGRSTRPRHADYSLTAQADRIAAVLDTLDVDDAVVVAHSLGGAIAYRLAIQRPDLVRAIVSIEGGPTESATTPSFRLAMRFAPLIRLFVTRQTLWTQAVGNLRDASGDPSWITAETVQGYTADASRDLGATLDAFQGMADAREPWRLVDRLGELRCPVYLLLGGADHKGSVQPDEVALLEEEVTDVTVATVEGAGHFIFEEQPDVVVEAIVRASEPRETQLPATTLHGVQVMTGSR